MMLTQHTHNALESSCEVTTSKKKKNKTNSYTKARLTKDTDCVLLHSATLQIFKVRACIQLAKHTDVARWTKETKLHMKTALLCNLETKHNACWKGDVEIIGPVFRVGWRQLLCRNRHYLFIWTHLGLKPETLWPQIALFLMNFQTPDLT